LLSIHHCTLPKDTKHSAFVGLLLHYVTSIQPVYKSDKYT